MVSFIFIARRSAFYALALLTIVASNVCAGRASYRPHNRSTPGPLLVTETTVLWRLIGGGYPYTGTYEFSDDGESRPYASFDLGILENSGRGRGYGGSAFLAVSSDTWRIGLRGRMRMWTSEKGHIDIAPGIILLAGNSKSQVSRPGFSGLVTYGANRWISAAVGLDILRLKADPGYETLATKKSWTDASVYAGLKLESYAGLVGPVAGVIVLILAAAAFGV